MKNNKIIYVLLYVFLFGVISFSCQEKKKVEAGVIDTKSKIYTNDDIGWEISIPEGWKVMTVDHREILNEKGKTAIEDVYDGEVDVTGLKHLLGFQKDQANMLNSTSQPFVEEYIGEWKENNEKMIDIILNTYRQNKMNSILSHEGIETIDNVVFNVYIITLTLPKDQGNLIQIMYSTLINNFDFNISINYTNKKYGDEMLSAFRASKFKKQEN